MESKIIAYILFIVGGFFALLHEYYYRKSIKIDKSEKSIGRNMLSWAIYLYLIFTFYVIIKLFLLLLS